MSENTELREKFAQPDREFRGLPFWSWNGKLDREELLRQVRVMKEMGFGGFFMHSRTGLETEYLGEEWFELIREVAEAGEREGMTAWLYDEDRWPSGTCGGEITKDPAYRMKYIALYEDDGKMPEVVGAGKEMQSGAENYGESGAGEVFGRFAVQLDGEGNLVSYRPISCAAEAMDGETPVVFVCEEMAGQEFYNGYTYVDTLNPQATEAFLKSTHEKYRERCGDLFGKSILGIFSDEPHRGTVFSSFGTLNPNRLRNTPYTDRLFGKFLDECGYDLRECLPELCYRYRGQPESKVMYDYIEILQQLFLEGFAEPVERWCRENRLIWTGHVLHEDSLSIQTLFAGSIQRFYAHMDYPGVDILTEGNRAYWVAKQVQSVARQFDKPFALSELYGCTGWQMNFESHRDVGVWQALFGINLRCHHLSWYTMEGEAKRDYPASILHQSGWYPDYRYIEDYFARINYVLSSGRPQCELLVINPVESVWMYPRLGWIDFLSPTGPEVQAIEEQYFALFHWLVTGQTDFDYGDESLLFEHGRIETEGGEPRLVLGRSSYRKVLIAGMRTIRSTTCKLLAEFAAAGGTVLTAGEPPRFVDAQPAVLPEELACAARAIPFEREAVLDCLKEDRIFSLSRQGKGCEKIMTTARITDGGVFLALLNSDREMPECGSDLRLREARKIERFFPEDGTSALLAGSADALKLDFEKGEFLLLYLTEPDAEASLAPEEVPSESRTLEGPFAYELTEENVLPLDMAAYACGDLSSQTPTEILRVDRAIRRARGMLLRGGEMIQPWFKEKYGLAGSQSEGVPLVLRFSFDVETLPEGEVALALEQSERFEVFVNGTALDKTVHGHWIDVCYDRLSVPLSCLRRGENRVELRCQFEDSVNLEAIYLLGGFGVRCEGSRCTLTALPDSLEPGDISNQGLPFYSGRVIYRTGVSRGRVQVKLGGCYGAITYARDGINRLPIAFAPYRTPVFDLQGELELEVALTRRNTFGPLHIRPAVYPAYGSDTFLTEGEHFSEEYSLIPQGLLEAPVIEEFHKN